MKLRNGPARASRPVSLGTRLSLSDYRDASVESGHLVTHLYQRNSMPAKPAAQIENATITRKG